VQVITVGSRGYRLHPSLHAQMQAQEVAGGRLENKTACSSCQSPAVLRAHVS
jgi:hypothetical protein